METNSAHNEHSRKPIVDLLKIISIAIIGSILMFGFVLKIMDRLHFNLESVKTGRTSNLITQLLTIMGFVTYAMHFVIPKLIKGFKPSYIVKLALLESTALFGFLIAVLNGDATIYAFFAALAIATILASLPDANSVSRNTPHLQ